jgi:hypothetical protein
MAKATMLSTWAPSLHTPVSFIGCHKLMYHLLQSLNLKCATALCVSYIAHKQYLWWEKATIQMHNTRLQYTLGAGNVHGGINVVKKSNPCSSTLLYLTRGSIVGSFALHLISPALAVSVNTDISDVVEYSGLSRYVSRIGRA